MRHGLRRDVKLLTIGAPVQLRLRGILFRCDLDDELKAFLDAQFSAMKTNFKAHIDKVREGMISGVRVERSSRDARELETSAINCELRKAGVDGDALGHDRMDCRDRRL
jgi:hypothetical protein